MSSSSSPAPNSPIIGTPPSPSNPPPFQPASPPPNPPKSTSAPPPSGVVASPPPPALPPPSVSSPPPESSPPPPQSTESPPPPPSTPPPPQPSTPPPAMSTPPNPPPSPPSAPPISPPSPPNPPPAKASPPPPVTPPDPPSNSPPPPESSPPPPLPPNTSPPPPSPRSPGNSPPPPSVTPPQNSPPPPAALQPPGTSPPPPNSAPPVVPSPSPPASPSSSDSPPIFSPPPPPLVLSPPSSTLVPPGNPNTNNSTTDNRQSPSDGGIGTAGTVAIGLVIGFLLLGLFGTAAFCVCKRKKKKRRPNGGHVLPTIADTHIESDSGMLKVQLYGSGYRSGSQSGSRSCIMHSPNEPGGLGNSRTWFTYDELVEATEGFPTTNLLGEGGFGSVYKGRLMDGREIAVKQLKIGGGQGEREFRAEVEIISRIHHRHLVSLVGYCITDNRRLLVYEYISNNTLYFHLHDEGRTVLDWVTRVKIAIGAARGIAYLHEDCHPRVIHRDIKSSNILLDNNFVARVSDFGLAKLAVDANTHITTRVVGTFGYMAPEYASSGKLTDKSDVYSFGVVLLELITGRKPVDVSQPNGEESLVEWARPLLSHALETQEFGELVDPNLGGQYVHGELCRTIEAAAACVRHSSAKRPKMGKVVRALEDMATSDLSNGMKVGESEIYNSAQQSEEIRLFRRMAFGSQDYSTNFFFQSSSSSEGNQT